MTTCAIYIRKSTAEHIEYGNRSTEVQLATCKSIAESAGYTIVEVYSQIISGYSLTADRSEFRRMTEDLKQGRFEVIVAVREDRIGRRLSETSALLDLCEQHGVKIHTENGVIDPATGEGTFIYAIMSALAQQEARMTSTRIKAHIAHTKHKSWVWSIPPFGFKTAPRNADGNILLVAHPEEAPTVKRMVELLLDEHKNIGEAASVLTAEGHTTRTGKPWTYKSVQGVILNPTIAGYASETRPGAPTYSPRYLQPIRDPEGNLARIHEPLVTVEQYERLRAIALPRETRTRKTQRSPFLSGLVFCSACGSKMVGAYSSTKDKIHRRYQCPGYAFPAEQRCKNGITSLVLEELIIDFVRASLKDKSVRTALDARLKASRTENSSDSQREKIEELKEAQRAIETELEAVTNARVIGILSKKLTSVSEELEALETARNRALMRHTQALSYEDIYNLFYSLEESERRFAISQVIERITIEPSAGKSEVFGGRRGSATDLSRVKIYRHGTEEPISLPPGTPAPLTAKIECRSCRQLVPREWFKPHYAECSESESER